MGLLVVVVGVVLLVPCAAVPQRLQTQESPADSYETAVHLTSWKNCGSDNDIAHLESLSISPMPIVVPGNVTVRSVVQLSKTVSSPISAEVELYKFVGSQWTKIPCFDSMGSCNYNDVCDFLPDQVSHCPFASCVCPFPAETYDLSSGLEWALDKPAHVPSWLGNGDFKAALTLATSSGQRVVCLELQATVVFRSPATSHDLEQAEGAHSTASSTKGSDDGNNKEEVEAGSCDPNTFEYIVCNLTSVDKNKGCPVDQFCKRTFCPLPGQCYWPRNCSCNATTHEMNCTNDPTHQTECNTKYCGTCHPNTELAAEPNTDRPAFVLRRLGGGAGGAGGVHPAAVANDNNDEGLRVVWGKGR